MNFWTEPKEQEFLLKHIKPTYSVLEYGSGDSTLILDKLCNRLTSVEHNCSWYNKICEKKLLRPTTEYNLETPNNPDWEAQYNAIGRKNPAGDDGSFEDFNSYVMSPMVSNNKPFDIVYVDGRARVACAFIAILLLNKNNPDARIFIHDFGPELKSHPYLPYRTYYDEVLNWLELVGIEKTMACFKPR